MTLPTTQGQTVPDAWDYKGHPVDRSKSGGWTSAAMILGVEACERLTTLGIAVNLVTYLTETMHLGNATSANIVTNFFGTSFMLCLLGGFIADTFLGRYFTIGIFTAVQATGVTILTVSTIIPTLRPPKCNREDITTICTPASGIQLSVLYLALYLTALGTGGLKSSVSGFGSDQFDDTDPEERSQMSNFFNWFFFFISLGSLCSVTILVYIQDNLGRDWGYCIIACAIVIGLVVFLSGTKRYRFKKLVGSPLTQIAAVFVAAWRKKHLKLPSDPSSLFNIDDAAEGLMMKKQQKLPHTKQFRFLDRAAIEDPSVINANKWNLATLTDVEEVKLVLRMLPIWATTIIFWTVYAQMSTFSVSQATTMDRHIGKFQIPPASLTVFFVGAILLTVPIYDRLIVPIARKVLKNPQGLTPLQRIAVGLVLSIIAMVGAALTEIKRLRAATRNGLTNNPTAPIPLSVFWLVPQFLFVGAGEAFTYIVDKVTRNNHPWLPDNLNQGRLYNFYWLLDKRLADEGIELEDSEPAFH
ncbi:Uncharacterized protein F383_16009 [Gossypium arboreum]|uniref:Protein NRT1/ PTR FAMILY 6.3-like n=1 Tax=Gossypium arboreum TaxID=29729 RepID=A0A0B0PVM3_GOSAR|nr:Uncharacterized protein F383_16009 [Gossypium arboreum]